MQLTTNSKKLIIAIASFTILGVILTAPSAPETPSESVANTSGQSTGQDFVLDPTTVKSLTNLTQNIQLSEVNDTQQYRGYVQGVGYSSYQLFAERGQKILFQLDASEKVEMLLYGTNIVPLDNNTEYSIPENGLYDLRILYKPSIELEQAKKTSAPEAYRIAFTLKAKAPATTQQ